MILCSLYNTIYGTDVGFFFIYHLQMFDIPPPRYLKAEMNIDSETTLTNRRKCKKQ